MYAPGVLDHGASPYSALKVMQNNRAYHQEYMHVQRMANRTSVDTRADIALH